MDRGTVVLVVDATTIAVTRSKMDAPGLVKVVVLRHRVTAMVFVKKEKIVTTARTIVDPRRTILAMAVSAALADNAQIAVAALSLLARPGSVLLKVHHQPLTTRAI